MNTLLLRLIGPMQSWGVQSRFSVRDTGLEPSKSGVIGLICAALGRDRGAPLNDLSTLRMGVRVDREGKLCRDYHIAGTRGYLKANGSVEGKNVIPSSRYYLADAAFLAGLESENKQLLSDLYEALSRPVWTIYLGRKAFPPAHPIVEPGCLLPGLPLEAALQTYPYLGRDARPKRLRCVIEDPRGEQARNDQPLSFLPRVFAPRRVKTQFLDAASLPGASVPPAMEES